MLGTKLSEFLSVSVFLNHFDGFLADVEAHILGDDARCPPLFLDYRLSLDHCYEDGLDFNNRSTGVEGNENWICCKGI